MAIKITDNGSVHYENENDVNRELFPNEPNFTQIEQNISEIENQLRIIETTAIAEEGITPISNYVAKVGNIGFLTYVASGLNINGNNGTICTLPEGCRPKELTFISINMTYNNINAEYFAKIQTDGKVQTATGNSAVTSVNIRSIPYPIIE